LDQGVRIEAEALEAMPIAEIEDTRERDVELVQLARAVNRHRLASENVVKFRVRALTVQGGVDGLELGRVPTCTP
jgi:hypothetical protein